jgi:hypothetical protein
MANRIATAGKPDCEVQGRGIAAPDSKQQSKHIGAPIKFKPSVEALAAAKAQTEAWLKDPPWFTFYDPYASFLSSDEPRFRKHSGEAVQKEKDRPIGAYHLLRLGIDAAREWLGDEKISKDSWKEALLSTKTMVADLRNAIPLERIDFRDPFGKPVPTPDRADIDAFEVVLLMHQLSTRPEAQSLPERDMLRQLWCIVCFREIDHALMCHLFSDAGDGSASAIRAAEALMNARASAQTPGLLLNGMTKQDVVTRMLDGKHRESRARRQQVLAWYDAHRNEYRSDDEIAYDIAGSARIGIHVPETFRTVRSWISQHRKAQKRQ